MKALWKLATATAALAGLIAGSIGIPVKAEAYCYKNTLGKFICTTAGGGSAGLVNGNDWDAAFILAGATYDVTYTYTGLENATLGLSPGDMVTIDTNFTVDQFNTMEQLADSSGYATLADAQIATPVAAPFTFSVLDSFSTFTALSQFSGTLLWGAATTETQGQAISLRMFRPTNEAATVPEPSTILLLGGGLAALAGVGIRRRRQAKQG